MTSWVAIDFETASSARSSACAVGLAVVDGGQIVDTYYRLIRPRPLHFSHWNVRVHGIRPADVEGEEEFPEVWAEVEALRAARPLVAHNAGFDMSVLRNTLDLYGLSYPVADYFCTMVVARRVWPHLPNHKLDCVAGHCDVSFEHHHAEQDAIACARVALACCRATGSSSLPELAQAVGVQSGRLHGSGDKPCSHW